MYILRFFWFFLEESRALHGIKRFPELTKTKYLNSEINMVQNLRWEQENFLDRDVKCEAWNGRMNIFRDTMHDFEVNDKKKIKTNVPYILSWICRITEVWTEIIGSRASMWCMAGENCNVQYRVHFCPFCWIFWHFWEHSYLISLNLEW